MKKILLILLFMPMMTWAQQTYVPDTNATWTQPTNRINGGEAISNLDAYPNPTKDIFNITFTSEQIQDLRVRVLNLVGEEIVSEDLQQFVGEYTKKINLQDYAKGIYFLEIVTNQGLNNKKLILQ